MYFRPKSIVRNLSIISCVIFINGCAMPLPFQVASWAIDGISYITTEKSVTDHGISFVAQKDCALLRIVQGQEICTNNEDNGIIAAIEAYPSWNTSELTEFELVDIQLANKMATTTETNLSLSPSFENNFKEKKSVSSVVPRQLVLGKRVWSNRLDANLYYVVGSFSNSEYAKSLIKKHSDLGPAVLVSFVNGEKFYRVAVGPFNSFQKTDVKLRIMKSGIIDAWALHIDHRKWRLSSPQDFFDKEKSIGQVSAKKNTLIKNNAPEV